MLDYVGLLNSLKENISQPLVVIESGGSLTNAVDESNQSNKQFC